MAKASRDKQYEAWGVIVQTSNVRAVHVANGLMQLLRLAPALPSWPTDVSDSEQHVTKYLRGLHPVALPPIARALCVYKSKKGTLYLEDARDDAPSFVKAGRAHVDANFKFVTEGAGLSREMQRLIVETLNADGKVMESGGSDPTTPGLSFCGNSTTHTLAGMHAVTFLGLLSRSPAGCRALARLHALARSSDDPHSRLVTLLKIDHAVSSTTLSAEQFVGIFPIPSADRWGPLAVVVGEMAERLLKWCERGMSKAGTLMAVIDFASLVLMTNLLRQDGRLLLMVAHRQGQRGLEQVISRAQESLKRAYAALDQSGATAGVPATDNDDEDEENNYKPSQHAGNLGAAGGWLYPAHARGGAKRYLRPSPRQLTTLVHCLVEPGEELSWPEFTDRAERFGLALGGPNEHRTEQNLFIGSATNSLRHAGRVNREHLVALGLARQESDNVVVVDGGGGQ